MSLVVRGLLLALFPSLVFCSGLPVPPRDGVVCTQPEKPTRVRRFEKLLLSTTQQYGIINQGTAPPLSSAQKFQLFSRTTKDPYHFVAVGFDAALSQATDDFHGYGQEMSGFGKRYGASFADDISSRFFGTYAYPSLFKEDPRYFRLGNGSIRRRVFYAMLQEFVAHRDGGGRRFNLSNPLGAVTAGAISNAYYPAGDRGFGLTMQRAGVSLLIGSSNQILKEFWPDIRHILLRPRKDKCPKDQPPSSTR